MIPAHTIDAVKSATDLQELVREYGIQLRQRPGYKVAWCPFCQKPRTPALYVYRDHAYCHRCQAHLSCFDWVMRMEQVRFTEAIDRLAKRAGISITGKPVSRGTRTAGRLDAEMFPWWIREQQNLARLLLDRELVDGPPADRDAWEWACCLGRLLRHPWTPAEFQCWATPQERLAWRAEVAEEAEFGRAWTGLAGEHLERAA